MNIDHGSESNSIDGQNVRLYESEFFDLIKVGT